MKKALLLKISAFCGLGSLMYLFLWLAVYFGTSSMFASCTRYIETEPEPENISKISNWGEYYGSEQVENVGGQASATVTWHPEGTLIKSANSSQVYVLFDGFKHWIQDEQVFNAHGWDWTQIILVSDQELACFADGVVVDWQPIRKVFQVEGDSAIYLHEKSAPNATGCVIYPLVSNLAMHSWGFGWLEIETVDWDFADQNYFSKCTFGGERFLRNGSLVKPLFDLPGYGAGVVFVAEDDLFLPIANWEVFQSMGYEGSLILEANDKEAFFASMQGFGEMIGMIDVSQCFGFAGLENEIATSVAPPRNDKEEGGDVGTPQTGFSDKDGDGSPDDLDCDDTDADIYPSAIEVCDFKDNDCNTKIDDGDLCAQGEVCFNGQCIIADVEEPEPEPEDDPPPAEEPEDDPPPAEEPDPEPEPVDSEIECTIQCPAGMNVWVWYGAGGEAMEQEVLNWSVSKSQICERGFPWIDFNCAKPGWSAFDPALAQISCNHSFVQHLGVIDSNGEGEVFFNDFVCYEWNPPVAKSCGTSCVAVSAYYLYGADHALVMGNMPGFSWDFSQAKQVAIAGDEFYHVNLGAVPAGVYQLNYATKNNELAYFGNPPLFYGTGDFHKCVGGDCWIEFLLTDAGQVLSVN